MDRPNGREHKALLRLSTTAWEASASLYPAGPGTIKGMIEKGWIVERSRPSGIKEVQLTKLGEAASNMPPSRRQSGGPKLSMVKSKIPIADGWAGKLKPKREK